jgi:acetoin utilization deacetylase AcuC-like enzyme
MTLIGPGTWAGARGAVDTALTAVDLVCGGERVAYALTRPPGHHVTRSAYGGSCYLNNAAVAAAALLRAGHTQVAVIDIDAHHGNGTQDIFYERADETGSGAGAGATLNMPIAPGSGDAVWLLAVTRLVEHAAKPAPSALVVSLGVDATAHDPESPLEVTDEGYAAAGALLAQLDVPVVVVQEGGYDLPTLGGTVAAALRGLTR